MLKKEIYNIADEILNEYDTDLDTEELSALLSYKISRMPFFKDNFSHLFLYNSFKDNKIILGHPTYNTIKTVSNNILHQTKINFFETKNERLMPRERIIIDNKQKIFLKDYQSILKNVDNIKDLIFFINKKEKIHDLAILFYKNKMNFKLVNVLMENCKNIISEEKIKKIKIVNDKDFNSEFKVDLSAFFPKKLEFLFKMGKNDVEKMIFKMDDIDILFPQGFVSMKRSPEEKRKMLTNLLKNEKMLENSLLKTLLAEKNLDEKKMDLYNDFIFQSHKSLAKKEINDLLKNETVEDIFVKYSEVVDIGIKKIVEKFPFILEKNTNIENCKIVQKNKKEGDGLEEAFYSDFLNESNYTFYDNFKTEIGVLGMRFFDDYFLNDIHENSEIFCLKDQHEIKGMANLSTFVSKKYKTATLSVITMNNKYEKEDLYKEKLLDAVFDYANKNKMFLEIKLKYKDIDDYYHIIKNLENKYPDLAINYNFLLVSKSNSNLELEKMENYYNNEVKRYILRDYFSFILYEKSNFAPSELKKDVKLIDDFIRKNDKKINELKDVTKIISNLNFDNLYDKLINGKKIKMVNK